MKKRYRIYQQFNQQLYVEYLIARGFVNTHIIRIIT
jgi:hypothetical protein